MAAEIDIKTRAVAFAKGAAIWLLTTLFVLLLSAALISEAFTQKFFEPSIYLNSLESHGLYKQMQKGMVELFSSRMPDGVRQNVTAAVSQAATEDYIRNQSTRLVTSFVNYFSSKGDTLDLTLDLSPVKTAFDNSPDPAVQALGAEMPVGMDFASQMRQTGQLERLSEFRTQVSQAMSANLFAFLASFLLLVPILFMYPVRRDGIAKCLELIFNAGTSTFIGGVVFAFVSPMGLPLMLGASSSSQGAASMISIVMGDVLREVGMLTIYYSIPFMAAGFIIPRVMGLNKPSQPAASATATAASATPAQPQGNGAQPQTVSPPPAQQPVPPKIPK